MFGRNDSRIAKKYGGSANLILNNLLSNRDYAVFYPVLVYIIRQLFHSLSWYMVDSRLGANAPRRLSALIRLEFVE